MYTAKTKDRAGLVANNKFNAGPAGWSQKSKRICVGHKKKERQRQPIFLEKAELKRLSISRPDDCEQKKVSATVASHGGEY